MLTAANDDASTRYSSLVDEIVRESATFTNGQLPKRSAEEAAA